ncbi:MAG TPA: hypothetical protein VK973_13200, partial [Arenicellales bacterium]|nr:hypothetical protein [Arenicellales bacterium]
MNTISPEQIGRILAAAGLIENAADVVFEDMSGGVSSEIWKVVAGGRVYCLKRALARLRVEAEWLASVERNRFEVRWYETAGRVAPGSAPRVHIHDDESMFFVMDYLDPGSHVLWKEKLRRGRAETGDADGVGRILARIHSATAGDPSVAGQFPRTDI